MMSVGDRAAPFGGNRSPEAPVRRRRRFIRLSGMSIVGLFAAFLMGILLLYVEQRVQLMTLEYRLQEIERQIVEARREQAYLQLQISQATAPSLIATRAENDLGMVRPTNRAYLMVEPAAVESETPTAVAEASPEPGGLLDAAIEWVTRYWPRVQGSAGH